MKQINILTILILHFSFLSIQSIIAQIRVPDNENGTWYTYYSDTEYTLSNKDNYDNKAYTITLNYPVTHLEYKAYLSDNVTSSHPFKVTNASGTEISSVDLNNDNPKNWLGITKEGNDHTSEDPYSFNKNIDNTTAITFQSNKKVGARKAIYLNNIHIRMAPHILLNTPNENSTTNFGEIEIGSETQPIEVKFKSFLTKGELIVTSSHPFFTINGNTSYTIAKNANTFCSIDDTKYDFKIIYLPTEAGSHSATITISDGTNKVNFTVKGSCKRKPNTINWNGINTQIPVGETVSLNNVTSSSNGNITFISSDTTKIKVENNQLLAVAEGVVTITAQVAETNEYEASKDSLIFESTQKTIQNIVWNQNFYLLKIGDSDITLNAYATDKETGIPNGNLVEYSVAESGNNIVTITNGILHIIGKGQTTITAHQRGDNEYASTYITKIVNIREVSNSCEDFLAVNAPDKVEKGNDNILSEDGGWNWDAFEVSHELSTIGDKLNFVTNCTSSATGKEIIVKDQNGTEIYHSNNFGTVSNLQLNRDVTSITISVKSNLTRSISNIYITPAIYVETNKDSITFSDTEIGISTTETIHIDWANQPDALWATIENDANNVFSVTKNNIFGGSCGDHDRTPIIVQFLSNTEGSYNGDLVVYMGYEKPVEKLRIPLTASSIYRETTFNKDGNWNEPTNWSGGIPTGIGKNAIINANAIIPDNYTAIVNNITIANGGSITIAPQGKLKANNINGATAENLTLQANENGSAILLFKNDESNKVNATVELYSLASSDGLRNGQVGNFKDPKWQYLGIAVENIEYSTLNPNGTSNWIYRWDETQNATSCWAEKLTSNSTLSAWIGYCLAQETATTYNYSGSLLNADHTYNLTYTPENASDDLGNNLITNSYTAPIDITTLKDVNFQNAKANIYIYKTGSYLEWKEQTTSEGFNAGQVIVIPVNTISILGNEYPRTIASMQAFFVNATAKEASFSINYENNVYNSLRKENQKRSKSLETENNFNVLKIQINSSTSNDRLYLLEHENTTDKFDNGYDAEKIFDNTNGPQIYATTPFGHASICSNTSFDGQKIGFIANSENEIYTMTFDIENLHSYEELYIYDTETKAHIDIISGESYQFYASTTPNNKRFQITSTRLDAPQGPTTAIENTTTWNEILQEKQPIYIYSITGQLIATYNSKFYLQNLKELHSQLTIGVYIVKSGNKTMKIIIENK